MAPSLLPTKKYPSWHSVQTYEQLRGRPGIANRFLQINFNHRETPRNDGTVMLTLCNILVPGPTLIHLFHIPSYIYTSHLNSDKFSTLAALVGDIDDLAL